MCTPPINLGGWWTIEALCDAKISMRIMSKHFGCPIHYSRHVDHATILSLKISPNTGSIINIIIMQCKKIHKNNVQALWLPNTLLPPHWSLNYFMPPEIPLNMKSNVNRFIVRCQNFHKNNVQALWVPNTLFPPHWSCLVTLCHQNFHQRQDQPTIESLCDAKIFIIIMS